MKFWKTAVVLCALPLFFVACGDDDNENNDPQLVPDPWSIQEWYNVDTLQNQTGLVQFDGLGKPNLTTAGESSNPSVTGYTFTVPQTSGTPTWNGNTIPNDPLLPANTPLFEDTNYVGAIDPNANENWADGWTVGLGGRKAVWGRFRTNTDQVLTLDECTCPAGGTDLGAFSGTEVIGFPLANDSVAPLGFGRTDFVASDEMRVCELPPRFDGGTLNLTKNCIYKIHDNDTRIGNGDGRNITNPPASKLLIEPGTLIYGRGSAALVITRGATIEALGTKQQPIVMTSETQLKARFDNDSPAVTDADTDNQEWAGLALMGQARSNLCGSVFDGCDLEAEGGVGFYGGDNDADNSGILQYVIVRHAGFEISLDNELNGITFYATGSGTQVKNIQVHRNFDDGVEFFGGTTFVRNVVLTEEGDESLDWDAGWRGGAQNVLAIQAPTSGNSCIEADNNKSNNEATPVSFPLITNVTCIGGDTRQPAFNLRLGTKFQIWNTIISGFQNGIDLNDSATFKRAGANPTVAPSSEGVIRNSIVNSANPFVEQ